MTKNKIYRYLGRNGIITTPILLEGATHIIMYRLIADEGMILSNGQMKTRQMDVFADELENWFEIPDKANEN
jgi:hypothetical protein